MLQIITEHADLDTLIKACFIEAVQQIPARQQPSIPIIITGEELANKLSVTIQTIIRWKAKGKIPYFSIGSSIRYDLNKVLNALEVNTNKARKS